jgi:hypothetical protein
MSSQTVSGKGEIPTLLQPYSGSRLGEGQVITQRCADRRFDFDVERVLHRLFDPSSERAAEKWRKVFWILGSESLELQVNESPGILTSLLPLAWQQCEPSLCYGLVTNLRAIQPGL